MPQLIRVDGFLMGTFVQISAYTTENRAKTLQKGMNEVAHLDALFSAHRSDSEISLLNARAGDSFVVLAPETNALLKKALYWAQKTGGAFDPTIGPVVALWQIGAANPTIPHNIPLQRAIKRVSYRDLVLSNDAVMLRHEEQALDLGGIAKGFAADHVASFLKSQGIKSALIDLGGNVVAIGKRADGKPWQIGIQDPQKPRGTAIGSVSIANRSVVTSGVYERYFEKNGKRYHHIFSPKTGYPVENGLLSVTILSDSSADGDALSTALFVMGKRSAIDFLKKTPGVEAIFIEKRGDKTIITLSEKLNKQFTPRTTHYALETFEGKNP